MALPVDYGSSPNANRLQDALESLKSRPWTPGLSVFDSIDMDNVNGDTSDSHMAILMDEIYGDRDVGSEDSTRPRPSVIIGGNSPKRPTSFQGTILPDQNSWSSLFGPKPNQGFSGPTTTSSTKSMASRTSGNINEPQDPFSAAANNLASSRKDFASRPSSSKVFSSTDTSFSTFGLHNAPQNSQRSSYAMRPEAEPLFNPSSLEIQPLLEARPQTRPAMASNSKRFSGTTPQLPPTMTAQGIQLHASKVQAFHRLVGKVHAFKTHAGTTESARSPSTMLGSSTVASKVEAFQHLVGKVQELLPLPGDDLDMLWPSAHEHEFQSLGGSYPSPQSTMYSPAPRILGFQQPAASIGQFQQAAIQVPEFQRLDSAMEMPEAQQKCQTEIHPNNHISPMSTTSMQPHVKLIRLNIVAPSDDNYTIIHVNGNGAQNSNSVENSIQQSPKQWAKKCNICNCIIYGGKARFEAHQKNSHFQHCICGNAFTYYSTLREHIKKGNKSAREHGEPNSHGLLNRCTPTPEYECDQCDSTFAVLVEAKTHRRSVHGLEDCNRGRKRKRSDDNEANNSNGTRESLRVKNTVSASSAGPSSSNPRSDHQVPSNTAIVAPRDTTVTRSANVAGTILQSKSNRVILKPFKCLKCHKNYATKSSGAVHVFRMHAVPKPDAPRFVVKLLPTM